MSLTMPLNPDGECRKANGHPGLGCCSDGALKAASPWKQSDSLTNYSFDPVCRCGRRFMFPHPCDVPTRCGELGVSVAVSRHVGLQLLTPPLAVGLRKRGMQGARMPETSVDEHRNVRSCECQVDPPTPVHNTQIHAVSEAPLGQRPATLSGSSTTCCRPSRYPSA